MANIAIFASGNGSNCENLIRYFNEMGTSNVSIVISNRPNAPVLKRAANLGVPALYVCKERFNDELAVTQLLSQYEIDFIVLAGFLMLVPAFIVERFAHRMVNIHPSLLPKYGGRGMYGRRVHEAVKASGDRETGITIHWVSSQYDEGDVIAQFSTPLATTDSVEDIERKVRKLEMEHFPETIENVLKAATSAHN